MYNHKMKPPFKYKENKGKRSTFLWNTLNLLVSDGDGLLANDMLDVIVRVEGVVSRVLHSPGVVGAGL